ncbi:MAG: AraC family transcriptional regulator [Clostridia bacterium]|nr:AraC family transcriptional regulator [Clostridia bacterium]
MWEDLIILGRMDDEPFSVELAGISYCDGSYMAKRESSPICVAEYIVSGSGRLICDGKTFYPSEGDVYVLPVGTDHFYSSSDDDPWVKIFMNINGSLANQLLSAYGIQDVVCFESVPAEPLFREAYELSKRMEGNVTREGFAELALIFHRIVMLLSRHEKERTGHSEMRSVKEYIDRNIYGKIKLSDAASQIYRSKDYVIKEFAAEYGRTPYEYALERKIEIARELLANTTLPISVIAERLGYSDQHYFSNLFKKRCNVTPSQYRRASLI